jgi:signal peptidase I
MKLSWFIKDEEKEEAIFEDGTPQPGDIVRIKEGTPEESRTWAYLGGRNISVTLPCGYLGKVVGGVIGKIVQWDNCFLPSEIFPYDLYPKHQNGWIISSIYLEIYKGTRLIKNEIDIAN